MRDTLFLVATAALLVVACNHVSEPSRVTTTGAPSVVTNEAAIERLTSAQCERARDCNNIGGTAKYEYPDDASCRREYHHDLEGSVRSAACPGGIREQKLSRCLVAIQNAKCGNPIDKIGPIATCQTGALCGD